MDALNTPSTGLVDQHPQRLRVDAKGTKAVGVGNDMTYSAVGDGSSVTHIGQQVVVQVLDDAADMAPEVRRVLGRESIAGAVGLDELREAVAAWRPGIDVPATVSFARLLEWQRELESEPEASEASGRMACAIAGLMECAVTAEFLCGLLRGTFTSGRLSAAARLAGLSLTARGVDPLQDLIECAVFEAQRLADRPGTALARLVAAFVHLAGADPTDAGLARWAVVRGLVVQLADAFEEFDRPTPDVRLVVSLADIREGSPGQAEYWLTRNGRPVAGTPLHATHDPAGVMGAVDGALNWAWRELGEGEILEHLDVVAPASLLVDLMSGPWALEDRLLRTFTLGANHSLLMRWSGRLSPDPTVPHADNITEINNAARQALRNGHGHGEPVTWLASDSFLVEAEADLRGRLASGSAGTAVGFSAAVGLGRALPVLLPYAPIVVWPRPGAPNLDETFRTRVRTNWHRQPLDFANAYRRHESDHPTDRCLCDLHAVSHDEAWLDFCRLVTGRRVAAPKETL